MVIFIYICNAQTTCNSFPLLLYKSNVIHRFSMVIRAIAYLYKLYYVCVCTYIFIFSPWQLPGNSKQIHKILERDKIYFQACSSQSHIFQPGNYVDTFISPTYIYLYLVIRSLTLLLLKHAERFTVCHTLESHNILNAKHNIMHNSNVLHTKDRVNATSLHVERHIVVYYYYYTCTVFIYLYTIVIYYKYSMYMYTEILSLKERLAHLLAIYVSMLCFNINISSKDIETKDRAMHIGIPNMRLKTITNIDVFYSKCNNLYTNNTNSVGDTTLVMYPVRHLVDYINNVPTPLTPPPPPTMPPLPPPSCNINCIDYDPSALGNIDPDVHYLTNTHNVNNTSYFIDQSFRKKYGANKNLSMLHLNIRSLPDHFLEFTTFLQNLDIELKIIALSETWMKAHHIDYNIPNYSMEQEYRSKKRGGGVCLYLHNSLQYKVRNNIKLGNDSESINSIFVEIENGTTGTNYNLIIGCVYRPPWVSLNDFNVLLTTMLESLRIHNKTIFVLGDFNADLSLKAEMNDAVEDFKNIFSTHHMFPLINSPTREVKSSKTIIDNIFCNIPDALDIYEIGIIRSYISDHHAIFCIMNNTVNQANKQYVTKRNYCDKHIAQFCNYLMHETWEDLGELGAQKAFTWFQGAIDLMFDKCFQKRTFAMTYRNRYVWMTNKLRTQITEKNILGLEAFKNPDNIELKETYKRKRNKLTSDMRNTEIEYYSNQLDIHKNDTKNMENIENCHR